MLTDDADLTDLIRSLRNHGQGSQRYDNVRIGMNGRLDTLQAAVLIEKLAIFDEEIAARDRIAGAYGAALRDVAQVPALMPGATSIWAQYTIVTDRRDAVVSACRAAGVPTAIHYPLPLSKQEGYRHFPAVPGGVPVSERLSRQVVSLPMHPYLTDSHQQRIIDTVRGALTDEAAPAAASG